MVTMKEVLTSFMNKNVQVDFTDGVMRITPKLNEQYPRFRINSVGTDLFTMEYKGDIQATGHSDYYRIDKVLKIGPVAS
jgi:hypothetical protein